MVGEARSLSVPLVWPMHPSLVCWVPRTPAFAQKALSCRVTHLIIGGVQLGGRAMMGMEGYRCCDRGMLRVCAGGHFAPLQRIDSERTLGEAAIVCSGAAISLSPPPQATRW